MMLTFDGVYYKGGILEQSCCSGILEEVINLIFHDVEITR